VQSVNASQLGRDLKFREFLSPSGTRPIFDNASVDSTEFASILGELIGRLSQRLPFDCLDLAAQDAKGNRFSSFAQFADCELPRDFTVDEICLEALVEKQCAVEVGSLEAGHSSCDLIQRALRGKFLSFRVVPLVIEGRTGGVLSVFRRQPGKFTEQDIRQLEYTGQLVSLVLENSARAKILIREKADLQMMLDINAVLISSLNVRQLFQEISHSIRKRVHQTHTHLSLFDQSLNSMRIIILDTEGQPAILPPDTAMPLEECPSGIAFQQGAPMVFGPADIEAIGSEYTKHVLAQGIRCISCFPLFSRGRKLGTLGLASVVNQPPSEDEIALLSQVASQVAIALDNARAYEEIAKFKDKLSKEKLYLEEEIRSDHNFGEVIGNSPALREVLHQVEIAAPSHANVLVLGDTGTGKELIARAVHRLSTRREGNFIKLNCAAIPTGLLESELFGHEKGAFTGAISQKVGRLELADKGTLFLDEIGEIPMELQPKLLRVLQDHEFERLGSVRTIRVDVRLISATNRDLPQAVENHQFRSDLYYRLNVFPIHVPPLRERTGDIPLLVTYFVRKFAQRMGKHIDSVPIEILRELERWAWPGNIRELENFIERSVILTRGTVLFAPVSELRTVSSDKTPRIGNTLEDVEREFILRTLRASGGVIAGAGGAAARLGMKRTTLQSRMQKLGITREEYET
jgi:formate hydrogenlyase transcriptional activator